MRSEKERPPVEMLHEYFREENGKLFFKIRDVNYFMDQRSCNVFNTKFANTEAGFLRRYTGRHANKPRWVVSFWFGGEKYEILRSIIVWTMHNGFWPDKIVDHEDRNQLNDRIGNLRLATNQQSSINTGPRKNNTSGYKGVSLMKRIKGPKKWLARIKVNYKYENIDYFDNPKDAHDAYLVRARELYGEFACSGVSSSLDAALTKD